MTEPKLLNGLSINELRNVWVFELGIDPPPVASQVFLEKALIYERQFAKSGDLSARDLKHLRSYEKPHSQTASISNNNPKSRVTLTPGARLIRNWNGKTYTVSVIEGGFVYQDKVWPSLSSIAKAITGAHWSGPRFFSTKTERVAT